jgi:hypothetical protein
MSDSKENWLDSEQVADDRTDGRQDRRAEWNGQYIYMGKKKRAA